MANMTYCMFQNTLVDLRDCAESDGMYEPDSLSADEQKARERLIRICCDIAAEFGDED